MQVEETTISFLKSARDLIGQGDFKAAARKAESAVDLCWQYSDEKIALALPLLSYIGHSTGNTSNLFDELDDFPKSLSSLLVEEAARIDSEFGDKASAKVVVDVNQFVLGKQLDTELNKRLRGKEADEKIRLLQEQIVALKTAGKRKLCLETMLELANEFSFRNQNLKAIDMYRLVLKQAWGYGFEDVRIDGLLDFGTFFKKLNRLEDAEHVLRLGAGVARNCRDRERYAQVIAELGIVMARLQQPSATRYLQKSREMLTDSEDVRRIDQLLGKIDSAEHLARAW